MTNTVVESIDDLKGKKIRTATPSVTQALELLGAVPMSKPASEIYEMVAGGVMDGAIIPLDSMIDFKLDGLLKKVNAVPGGLVSSVMVIAINPESWARITPGDQQAILAISGKALADRAAKAHDEELKTAAEKLKAAGVEIIVPDQKVVEEIQSVTRPVRDAWIAEAAAAGMQDPKAMLDFIETQTGVGG